MTDTPPVRAPYLLAPSCDPGNDATAEIWRSLAVAVDSAMLGDRRETEPERPVARSLLVTSVRRAVPAVACRVAVAVAELGWSTCLVDGAARLTDDESSDEGLAGWFAEECPANIRFTETDIARLTLVRGGDRWQEIAGTLRIDRVRALTDHLSDRCRWIVWAGPPLVSAAGMAVAGGVDAVLLAVTPGRVTREDVRRARAAVASVHGNLLGTVLSGD